MVAHMNDSKKRGMRFVAMLAVFTVLLVSSSWADELKNNEFYVLSILHTNDIHGNVDKLPQYATVIKQMRTEAKNLLVLEGGDIFLRGEFDGLAGVPEMKMLNEIGYDAWVIGNNDFRVPPEKHSPQNIGTPENLIALAKAKTLCANVVDKDSGKLLKGVDPYMIKNINGVRVGVIGLTSVKPQNRNYEPNKKFLDAVETLKKCLAELKGKTDVNIVLSHCGLAVDLNLSYVPGIAAVIGADDHYVMENPLHWVWEGEKSTPIVQHGGEDFHMLGRLDLVFQKKDGVLKLMDFQGKAYDMNFVPRDKKVQDIIDEYRPKAIKMPKPELKKAA